MVYLGYDFNSPVIKNKKDLPISIQETLSKERLEKAKSFLKDARDFIASELGLFRKISALKQENVGISIMENYTGQEGYPDSEEQQAWHTDYGANGKYGF